jgi:methylmalonyl-CoA mutase N-terminal domain/subunit
VTLQAMAAALGGTQSLHTNAFDEALALPTEHSVRIALRTQQIIAEESGITETCDPVAGSYFVEYLTNEIEKRACEYIKTIDKMGGAVEAIKRGYFQDEISRRAYQYQKQVEDGEKTVVGVNAYMQEDAQVKEILKIDKQMTDRQLIRIKKFKETRDSQKVATARKHLESAARSQENLMPYIINCVEMKTTLGEVADSLRSVFGNYQEGN